MNQDTEGRVRLQTWSSSKCSVARSAEETAPNYCQLPRVEHSRGSNWIHPSLGVVDIPGRGYGVIATEPITDGTTLIVFGGKVITLEDFEALSHEMQNYPYQIDDDLFLSPVDLNDLGIGERINHSCNPTAGFRGAIHLVAIRDIGRGEQVTIDYATCVSADDDAFVMDCTCGSILCRKKITGQDWQLEEVQSRLLPYFQPYLQERIGSRGRC